MLHAVKTPSGKWRVQPTKTIAGNTIRTSITRDSRKEALVAAELWKADTRPRCELTVKQTVDAYIEMRKAVCSPTTIRSYNSIAKTSYASISQLPLCDLTQPDIQHQVSLWAAKGDSPKTIKNKHGLLSAAVQQFRPDMIIRTTLPIRTPPTLYIPSDKEIRAVLDAAEGTDIYLPILLAAYGPMRRAEISALDASDIEGSIVHVRHAYALSPAREWILKGPKSKAGDRYITYPDFVANLFPKSGPVCRLYPDDITREFEKLLKKNALHHFRFHDLRHYCASRMHALGIPDAYIMERGGWSSDTVLKTVYRHTLNDVQADMTTKINRFFEKSAKQNALKMHSKRTNMA